MTDECDCGYCGKCREQWYHENDPKREEASYDKPRPKDDDEPKHYYWRL